MTSRPVVPPAGDLLQRLERVLLDAQLAGEGVLSDGTGFELGVVDHLPEDVAEQAGPVTRAGVAE